MLLKKLWYKYCSADPSYKMITNTRTRLWHALKRDIKSSSTKDLLRIDNDFFQKMDTNWSRLEVDNIKPLSYFDVSIGEEIREALYWIFSQTLLKEVHQLKRTN